MLPVESWRIFYEDGSDFSSEDGPWAEAPAFGVQCVVYYHVPDEDGLQRKTQDGGVDNGDVYFYQGEEPYVGIKLGLWMDSEGFYRIQDLASRSTKP